MTEQVSLSPRAWAELLLLSLLWGGSFLAIRVALDEVPVMTSVLHRVGWAALLLWAVALARRLPLPGRGHWGAFLVMGALNNVIPFGLMAWAQLEIESGLVSIFNAATAIFAVIVAALVFADERLTPARGAGVALGFLGVVTAIGWEALWSLDLRALSQIAVLGGALSYALAGVWARRRLTGLPPVVAAAGMLTGSAVLTLPIALALDGVPSMELAPRTWLAIAYYAGASTALAYLLYYRVLAMAGSGNLLLCTLMIPPVAIVLGWAFLGEHLPPTALAGFALIALGLLILDGRILGRNRSRPNARQA